MRVPSIRMKLWWYVYSFAVGIVAYALIWIIRGRLPAKPLDKIRATARGHAEEFG